MLSKALIVVLVILFLVGAYVFIRPLLHFPGDRVKILMCGRSTMGMWFKHWNWPYPLRVKFTYRPWPISYKKYSHGNLYLDYWQLAGPKSKDPNIRFGEKMLERFREGLDTGTYDLAFFKFCFVDFPVDNETEGRQRYSDLIQTVTNAYQMTSERNMKLIVGNALPLLKPNDPTLELQKEYNTWLDNFASNHDDVMVFDFFSILTDRTGKLRKDLARSADDSHPNDKTYTLLDEHFFAEVQAWTTSTPRQK